MYRKTFVSEKSISNRSNPAGCENSTVEANTHTHTTCLRHSLNFFTFKSPSQVLSGIEFFYFTYYPHISFYASLIIHTSLSMLHLLSIHLFLCFTYYPHISFYASLIIHTSLSMLHLLSMWCQYRLARVGTGPVGVSCSSLELLCSNISHLDNRHIT